MFRLTVLYGKPEDQQAFHYHFENKHKPIVARMPYVRHFESGTVIENPSGDASPPYYCADLWFDTLDSLRESMESEAGSEAANDVSYFATGGATMLIQQLDSFH